jgi:hypothetical protein
VECGWTTYQSPCGPLLVSLCTTALGELVPFGPAADDDEEDDEVGTGATPAAARCPHNPLYQLWIFVRSAPPHARSHTPAGDV